MPEPLNMKKKMEARDALALEQGQTMAVLPFPVVWREQGWV